MAYFSRSFLFAACATLVLVLPAGAAVVNATWSAATDVPASAASYTAMGNTINFTLNFAPATGTNLTVVNNTGLPFISGTFDNLSQGQAVVLSYGGVSYSYVAHYYGGTGNDLVLVWANNRAYAWGYNSSGRVGDGSFTQRNVMVPVTATGALAGKTILSLSQGFSHSLALCSDGTIAAWGDNSFGQLGDNSSNSSSVPVKVNAANGTSVLYGKTVVAVSAGYLFSMALCSDGSVATWGYNAQGQLGNNTYTYSSAVPVAINTTSGTSALYGKTVVAISAGDSHCMTLCSDGSVMTWGANVNGQLGNNSNSSTSIVPMATKYGALASRTVVAIAAGYSHSLALCSDGTVASWGDNTGGALGNGTNVSINVPVGVVLSGIPAFSGKTVASLAAGYHFSLALCTDGTVLSWGYNAFGQLGDATTTARNQPVAVSTASGVSSLAGKNVVAIAANGYSAAALCADGSMSAWGRNNDGSLGNNTTTDSPVPVAVVTSPLAVGERIMSCANSGMTATSLALAAASPSGATALVAVYGSASTVPASYYGSALTGSSVSFTLNFAPAPGTSLMVVNNPGLEFISGTFSNLAQGQVVSLSYNGASYNFVANYYGGTGNDLVLVWAGTRPVAWGVNTAGELGNNIATHSSTPVAVTVTGTPLASRTVLALATGFEHSLALCTDGSVVGWGYNADGELGNGTVTNYSIPVGMPTAGTALAGKTVIAIGAGLGHSLALCSDGSVVDWGLNSYGQLGNGSTTGSTVPVAVRTTGTALAGKTVVAISVGAGHNLMLCSDGTMAAWGFNGDGELGNGGTTNSSVPVAVTTAGTPLAGRTVIAIAAGSDHNLALCSDGTLVAWGANDSGQLGNNTTTGSQVPVAVTTTGTVLAGKTIIALAAGVSHNLALCSDGTLAAWGDGSDGELGNGSTTPSLLPVAVSTSGVLAGKTVVAVTAGASHSVARCADGTVAAWGLNTAGQLGNNSTTSSSLPVAVSQSLLATGERFVQVTSGSFSVVNLGLVATPAPAAISLAATAITANGAVINGTVSAGGGSATVSFDYGLSSAYGTNAAGTPATVSGGSATAVSTTLSGLTPGTAYHFRVNASSSSGLASGGDLFFTTPMPLQNWRQNFFGTTANSGRTADTADYDGDGIPNLLEYALNLSPAAPSKLPVVSGINGANYEYTYSRSSAAVNAGTLCKVEWSGTLPATWSSSGVSQTVLSDDGTTQQVRAVVPVNAANALFIHLSVTAPP